MSEIFKNLNDFKNAVLTAFLHKQEGFSPQVGNTVSSVSYPSQFFQMEKFQGPWKEMGRTPNPLQQFDGQEAVHMFSPTDSGLQHTMNQGDKKLSHTLNCHTNNSCVTFSESNNNFFGIPNKMCILGLYNDNLDLVTDPTKQSCTYAILSQEPRNSWILARPGFENNAKAADHLMKFTQRLGYNTCLTHPELVRGQGNQDILINWDPSNFPADGTGRKINIEKNKILRFKSESNGFHTVAEAIRVKDGKQPTGYSWAPHPEPRISSPPACVGFNRTLKIGEPGTYFLVSPVGTDHKIMRIQVNVYDIRENQDDQMEDVISGMNE